MEKPNHPTRPPGQPPRQDIVGPDNSDPRTGNYPVPSPESQDTPRPTSTEWEDHEGAIHRKPLVTGRIEYRDPQESGVRVHSTEDAQPEKPASRAPNRKVVSQSLGGALGGNVAVVVAYHVPSLPTEIVGAYTAICVVVLGFLAGYFVPAAE